MKRIILPVVAALSLMGGPLLAATKTTNACSADMAKFDTAVVTTKASKADVAKADTLRAKAGKLCAKKSSVKKGEADLTAALALIGVKA